MMVIVPKRKEREMKQLPTVFLVIAGGVAANLLIWQHAYEPAAVAGVITGVSAFCVALVCY